ncbi:uncharacterized protein [Amphiura filiformis]|uniref:uncharacterized protein n=1 Tax=Amphiura filiformis TaxID=82378 RepID=UPI003B228727
MATAQKVKAKKGKKVVPATDKEMEDLERPSSVMSHNSWVEDLDLDKPSASEVPGTPSTPAPAEITAVVELPRSPSPLKGSVLSVREAIEDDRVSHISEDENIIPPPAEATRPESLAGSRPVTPVSVHSRPHTPVTPVGIHSRPHTPTTVMERSRNLSPTPAGARSRSVSPLAARRRAKVMPTDDTLPPEGDNKPADVERIEAWSETSSAVDLGAVTTDNTRPQSRSHDTSRPASGRTRSPGEGMHAGSAPSMHSLISVQEAKEGNKIDATTTEGEKSSSIASRSKSVASLRSQVNQDDTKSIVSRTSGRLKPPVIENEQQAYVPFMYARDCLAKVMDDMKKMKNNHIRIVGLIEDAYKKIEDETQAQFNVFVIGMRDQYKGKVKTFRQVIHIHQEDFGNHKTYWQEALNSLNSRNKELMKDKKRLLVINKVEIERLEKEKEQLMTELSQKIDHEHQEYSKTNKQLEESSQEMKIDHEHQEYSKTNKQLEESSQEMKILQDQLTSEKDENEQLKTQIEKLKTSGGTGSISVVASSGDAATSSLVEENQYLKEEIEQLRASVDGGGGGDVGISASVGVDATVVAATAAASEEERKRLKDDRNKMQEEKIQAQKELATMRAKYDALHTQYTMIAAAAVSDDNKDKMQEQIDSVQKDNEIMHEEGDQLKEEIEQWKVDFKERTGKEPTDEDKSESVKELETQLAEVENKQVELDAKCTFMKALKEGHVPEVQQPEVDEPIIKTVEVTVADPTTVAALEASQQKCRELQTKITSMERTIKDKDKTIKQMGKNKPATTTTTIVKGSSSNDKDLKLLLKTLVDLARSLILEVRNDAEDIFKDRLTSAEEVGQTHKDNLSKAKEAVESWEEEYTSEHGNSPDESDRDGNAQALYATMEDHQQQVYQNKLDVTAWNMLNTGEIPEDFKAPVMGQGAHTGGGANSEEVSNLEERIEELEEEKSHLESVVEQLEDKIRDLESSAESPRKMDFSLLDEDIDEDDVEGFSTQLASIRAQVDEAEKKLSEEQEQHEKTKAELEVLRQQYDKLMEENESADEDTQRKVNSATVALKAELEMKEKALKENKKHIDELEKEKLKGVPVDTAKEIEKLRERLRIITIEKEGMQKERIGGSTELEKLRADNVALTDKLKKEQNNSMKSQDAFSKKLSEKDKKAKEQVAAVEKKYQQREGDTKKQIQSLEKKIKELNASGGGGGAKAAGGGKGKPDAKTEKKLQLYQEQVASLKKQIQEEQNKTKAAKDELKESRSGGAADKQAGKKMEKQMKDLEKKYENEQKKFNRENKKATEMEAELKTTNKELDSAKDENKKLQLQINSLGVAAQEALELKEKADEMKSELKTLTADNKALTENYNSERVLRKKYYNQIEDMKGKIRVYCRGRPLSGSEKERGNFEVVKAPDEYTIQIESNRGNKEFQFDHIFLAGSTQEEIFEDTNNLIQSAVDGYNVCIFAYGQTGSGKTFTMIGDKEQKFPGIAPRAFNRIFDVMEESKSKFSFKVSTYMLELYNEKLIDLYAPHGKEPAKLDIKKDQKGLVFINGSVVQEATSAKELYGLFDSGSLNRHVASTKMNSESSRSHLVIGIIIESTNLSTGTVVKGKLSLVDLAGSERAAKTGATAEQLKEANSINKSLSALGDVISALSSEQSFIPYRNNKLTMLMQDSLGGNAKTLMFVNISPADYNAEETIISLTYASRVKLITNDASKNADNKEIARLKKVIQKLKAGEEVDEDAAE